jgi:hypothetical protein
MNALICRAIERLGEPLHVVLHEDLHRVAADRAGALDRTMHPPPIDMCAPSRILESREGLGCFAAAVGFF